MIEAPPASSTDPQDRVNWLTSIPFIAIHAWAVWAVFHTGFSAKLAYWGLASYYLRMMGVTIGYHRYFSHRAFKTNRVFQFVLAWWAQLSVQKGALWWAAHHRHHHKFSDMPEDVHSPLQRGFWYSHVGWMLGDKYLATEYERIKDFAKYPELRFINEHWYVPPVVTGGLVWALYGFDVFLWVGIISTVALWHGTFFVNSLAHVWGYRRYLTTDTSRNNFVIALITCGEGWHNNHHFYQSTANQGWHWWQVDLSFYAIRIFQLFGLVNDVRTPPKHVVDTPGNEPLVVKKLKERLPNLPNLPELPKVELPKVELPELPSMPAVEPEPSGE